MHVDRTACPWLIKRFVDPKAEFIFVPVENIEEIVKKDRSRSRAHKVIQNLCPIQIKEEDNGKKK